MKAPALLLSLSVFAPFCTMAALPPCLDDATGKLTVRFCNRLEVLDIDTDRFDATRATGEVNTVRTGTKTKVSELSAEAASYQQNTGLATQLTGWVSGKPRKDSTWRAINSQLFVELLPSVDRGTFIRSARAASAIQPSYAEHFLVLNYPDVFSALRALDRIREAPGVVQAEPLLSVKRVSKYIPNDRNFSHATTTAADYGPRVKLWENVRTPNLGVPDSTSRPYQWYLRNTGENQPLPLLMEPDVGDLILPGDLCDIRADLAWDQRSPISQLPIRGNNVKVLVVDDGLEKAHADFTGASVPGVDLVKTNHDNYVDRGWDPLDPNNPTPSPANIRFDFHGTACAGIIGARMDNAQRDITGVAPLCTMMGIRILGGNASPLQFANAVAWGSTQSDFNQDGVINTQDPRTGALLADVANNSWGPATLAADDLYPEHPLVLQAFEFALRPGPKDCVFVFAAGNEGDGRMNTNYQETTNRRETIAVGCISDIGRRIAYSNVGASLMCVAPGMGDELPPLMKWTAAPPAGPAGAWPASKPIRKNPPIEPWDIPPDFREHRRPTQGILSLSTQGRTDSSNIGTSFAAPQVAGVVALMKQANPQLKWRDIQEIIMRSTRMVNDCRWDINGQPFPTLWRLAPMGKPFHFAHGAGLIDADKAVRIAMKWKNLPFSTSMKMTGPSGRLIPDNNQEGVRMFIPGPPAGMRVEHVSTRVKWYHGRRGDTGVNLFAPPNRADIFGMKSELFVPHREDYNRSEENFVPAFDTATDWKFMSLRHWGYRAVGSSPQWTVQVWDNTSQGTNLNPTVADPVYVPVANPTDPSKQKIAALDITYYGCYGDTSQNDPPNVPAQNVSIGRGQTIQTRTIRSGGSTGIYPIIAHEFYLPTAITPKQPTLPTTGLTQFATLDVPSVSNPTVRMLITLNRATGEYTFTPSAFGVFAFYVMVENDLGYSVPREIRISVRQPTPTFNEWATINFTPAEIANPAISGPTADPDQDGLANYLEYAMGTQPKIAEDPAVPTPVIEDGNIVYTYTQDIYQSEAFLLPQISADMVNWENISGDTPGITIEAAPVVENIRTFTLRIPIGDPRRYFRLKAQRR
jgi:subtilisin-like proprotein convertase family protein